MKYLVGIATTVDKAFDASVLLDDRGFVYVSFGQEGPTREVFVLTRVSVKSQAMIPGSLTTLDRPTDPTPGVTGSGINCTCARVQV